MVAPPALTTSIWAVGVGAFLGGMGGTLGAVNVRTFTQHKVPDQMLGRYDAAARRFNHGAMQLEAALVGLLAELGSMRLAFAVFAVGTAVTPARCHMPFPRRRPHHDGASPVAVERRRASAMTCTRWRLSRSARSRT